MALTKVTNSLLDSGALVSKAFGTSSIMIGDDATGTIDAANNNTGVGVDVFAALTSGDNNTAIGTRSFNVLTTGTNNVGVGYNTGQGTTTGNRNTFIGDSAGNENTTASNNTAVGYNAMLLNTTGSENTAMGRLSLDANTTGTDNTAVGNAALSANTTGSNNTAFGSAALFANTSSYNTAVGKDALTNVTSGTHNVGLGFRAGNGITTGGDITVLGNYAGYTGIGTRSTAIGYSAGYNCTGSDNTLIGKDAGQGSYPLTSGSNCTMVGALARPSGTLGNANGENVFGYNMGANGAGTTTIGSGNSGLYATHGGTSWTAVSDERYKKDIVDSEVGLSFINDLRPRNFKWKTCGEVPSDTPRFEEGSDELIHPNLTGVMHGFIAQEIKTVIDNHSEVPDNQLIWKEDPDGIQGLAEGELVPALVKAIQELSAKNDALEARIETLEG
jgi:trimeric autotransporter adhesin